MTREPFVAVLFGAFLVACGAYFLRTVPRALRTGRVELRYETVERRVWPEAFWFGITLYLTFFPVMVVVGVRLIWEHGPRMWARVVS